MAKYTQIYVHGNIGLCGFYAHDHTQLDCQWQFECNFDSNEYSRYVDINFNVGFDFDFNSNFEFNLSLTLSLTSAWF